MQQSLIFLLTDELFISIMLRHPLYIFIVSVNFFFWQVVVHLFNTLQTEYTNLHANSATLIFMQTRLYIANPKPCFSIKKTLNRGKLHKQKKNHIFWFLQMEGRDLTTFLSYHCLTGILI